jgi:hypothetical protein
MQALAALAFFAAMPNAVVLRPVVNMYSRPSEDADLVSQAIYGANTAIVERRPGWLRIRTADAYTGWAQAADLKEGPPYAAGGEVAEITSLFAHIYREADVTRHAPLVTLPFETRLETTGEPAGNGRWIPVRLPDGRAGWLQAGDTYNPARLTIPEMLELARRFIGLPYTWGGTSSFGYDCSGFSQMLARRRGVLMPRDAQPQAEWSGVRPVTRAELAPGDLLFFGSSAAHITHTGTYMGDGKFISATTWQTPTVHIDDLGDPHWAPLLVAMRRIK